jgi:hypothetical protein
MRLTHKLPQSSFNSYTRDTTNYSRRHLMERIDEIDLWTSMNRLESNSDKTQFIWLGSQQQLLKVGVANIQLGNNNVALQSNVYNLGVRLQSTEDEKHTCRVTF